MAFLPPRCASQASPILHKAVTFSMLLCVVASIAVAVEPTRPVGGRVVDEKGQPLAGARVTAYQFQLNTPGAGEEREVSSVVTGADGRFLFNEPMDASALTIVAIKDGKCVDWTDPLNGFAAEPVLQLGPAAAIEGEIVDEEGKAVAGASVAALLRIETPTARKMFRPLAGEVLKARTDAQGRFRFANIPETAVVGFDLSAPGRARALADRPFAPGQKGLRFVLPPEGRLNGRVVEKGASRALANVCLQAVGSLTSGVQMAWATTDKEGRFSLSGLSGGKYRVSIVGAGKDLPEWIGSQEKAPVETGKVASDVKIEAVRGGILELVLTDAATNEPVAGTALLHIAIAEDRRIGQSGWASKDGVARFHLAPGNYAVTAVGAVGYSYEQGKGKPFRVEEGKTARAAVVVTAVPPVTGLVRDPGGRPVPRAKVRILPMVGATQDVVTGDDGRFTINAADLGTLFCFILARHPQENLAALDVTSPGEKPPAITLQPLRPVAGAVLDSQGRPVAGASVQAQIDASHLGRFAVVATARTDKDGRYQMELAAMSMAYAISARAPGCGVAEMVVPAHQLTQGQGRMKDLVFGAADRVVRGAVKDAQGRPVAGVIISAKPSGGAAFSASPVTDDKGQFILERLGNEAVIYLDAVAPGRGWIGDGDLKPGQADVVITVGPSRFD